MIRPARLISGAQTGADLGGLRAAAALGIPTGGFCPLGCQTETGAQPWLIARYGLTETPTRAMALRTLKNLAWADLTALFGDLTSPGSRLAWADLRHSGKPCLVNPTPEILREAVAGIQALLTAQGRVEGVVLNVAGNRASRAPAIEAFVFAVVVAAFWDADLNRPRPATPLPALPTLTTAEGAPWVHPAGLTSEAYRASLAWRPGQVPWPVPQETDR